MTKYFCDGCGKEITEKIYRVKIYVDEQSKSSWEKLSDVLAPYASSTANLNGAIAEQPMYCQKCAEKIENFIAYGL